MDIPPPTPLLVHVISLLPFFKALHHCCSCRQFGHFLQNYGQFSRRHFSPLLRRHFFKNLAISCKNWASFEAPHEIFKLGQFEGMYRVITFLCSPMARVVKVVWAATKKRWSKKKKAPPASSRGYTGCRPIHHLTLFSLYRHEDV